MAELRMRREEGEEGRDTRITVSALFPLLVFSALMPVTIRVTYFLIRVSEEAWTSWCSSIRPSNRVEPE
jgi:hypothetical protein